MQDPATLKRFLHKEDIRELPGEEEQWEVPAPFIPEVIPDRGTEDTLAVGVKHQRCAAVKERLCVSIS